MNTRTLGQFQHANVCINYFNYKNTLVDLIRPWTDFSTTSIDSVAGLSLVGRFEVYANITLQKADCPMLHAKCVRNAYRFSGRYSEGRLELKHYGGTVCGT